MVFGHQEFRGGELKEFNLENDFINPAPTFFTHVHSSHEGGESFIAGLWGFIDEPQWVYKGLSWIGNLDAIGEDFHHRAGV